MAGNKRRMQLLDEEAVNTTSSNIVLGVVGLFFLFPLWFALDLKTHNAIHFERASFFERNGILLQKSHKLKC